MDLHKKGVFSMPGRSLCLKPAWIKILLFEIFDPSEINIKKIKSCVFCFILIVSEIPNPPQQYNGEVNARSFWEAVTMEVISRGLYPRKSGVYSTDKWETFCVPSNSCINVTQMFFLVSIVFLSWLQESFCCKAYLSQLVPLDWTTDKTI